MHFLSLDGTWQLSQSLSHTPLNVSVPGCLHTDLLSHNLIPDPFILDNEERVIPISSTPCEYTRSFDVDSTFLSHPNIVLQCDGLDTLAEIRLNDVVVASVDNMFRSYEFPVRNLLKDGVNVILVSFQPPAPVAARRLQARHLANWGVEEEQKLPGGNYLRKCQSHFGWDWGPKLPTMGIYKSIRLAAYDVTRIRDVRVTQCHQVESFVLGVRLEIDLVERPVVAALRLHFEDEMLHEDFILVSQIVMHTIEIAHPKLWWPNTLGEQPLYTVSLTLETPSKLVLDKYETRIGLRTLSLVREPDAFGESFYFSVNNTPFFARGANWIPADIFPTRVTKEQYRSLLGDCKQANMNMIRVWGGGFYEDEAFYEACDELGICVWQDFMFACAAYPAFDMDWLDNVQREAEYQVKRLKHHSCLALWCGNNELEQGIVGDTYTDSTMSWEDYRGLFDERLRFIVKKHGIDTDYWPGSPHTPGGTEEGGLRYDFNNPNSGDAHLWGVWHGGEKFEWYRQCGHRFNSEFGFQSFTDIHTTRKFLKSKDDDDTGGVYGLENVCGRIMEHHQRSGIGNTTIIQYLAEWFLLPTSFENVLWTSQILQAVAIKFAVEHWRRSERGMGTLYWQLNDCWPGASWSSIDYYGRWKALHYEARRFYNAILVSGVEKTEEGKESVAILVNNDSRENISGVVEWQISTTSGATLSSGRCEVSCKSGGCVECTTVDCVDAVATRSKHDIVVRYHLEIDGTIVSQNHSLFVRPKHLRLQDPRLSLQVEDQCVIVTAQAMALWVFVDDKDGLLEMDDAFFHLQQGETRSLRARRGDWDDEERLRGRLRARSLFDLTT